MQQLGPKQEAWVEVLETTTLPQGREKLKGEKGFCCLGIYCEVFHPDQEGEEWRGYEAALPPEYGEELAMYDEMGRPSSMSDESFLPLFELNDRGSSFKEIAAIIRANPSLYFKEPR